MKHIIVLVLGTFIAFFSLTTRGYSLDLLTETLVLTARDAGESDHFGYSVHSRSGLHIIGAPLDNNESGVDAGAVYIFDNDGVERQKLIPPGPSLARGRFGHAVFRDGPTLLATAPYSENGGRVFVFRRNPASNRWEHLQSLVGEDTERGDQFGTAVAKFENFIFIGARRADLSDGSTYVFELAESGTWEQKAKLTASDRTPAGRFGSSIAVAENLLVIGSPGLHGPGAAYIFEYNELTGWHETNKLSAELATAEFGFSVLINGSNIIIGAPWDGGGLKGAVHVFEKQGGSWEQVQKLTNTPRDNLDLFGKSLTMLSNNVLLIGVPGDAYTRPPGTDNDDFSGATALFGRNSTGWWEDAMLVRSLTGEDYNPLEFAALGFAISGDSNVALVGALGANVRGKGSAGAAYIYYLSNLPPLESGDDGPLDRPDLPMPNACPGIWKIIQKYLLFYDDVNCKFQVDECVWTGCEPPARLSVLPGRLCDTCEIGMVLPREGRVEILLSFPDLKVGLKELDKLVVFRLYNNKQLVIRGKPVIEKVASSKSPVPKIKITGDLPAGSYVLRVDILDQKFAKSLGTVPFEFQVSLTNN